MTNTEGNRYKNVLLIDTYTPDSSLFYQCANADTLPILYSYRTTRQDILDTLARQIDYPLDRLALCFASSGTASERFLQGEDFFSCPLSESANVQFILELIRRFQIRHLDYLACNTLSMPTWKAYYTYVTEETGITLGASNDPTGNLIFGGDWVMESTGENIQHLYFTQEIENFPSLLDTAEHTIVLKGSGSVYGCGRNNFGQLGTGNTFSQNVLLPITINISNKYAKYVSCGASFTMILMTDGSLYTCGQNLYGQLGLGDNGNRLLLTQVTNLSNRIPKYVSCGENFTMVITTDEKLYGTGQNNFGQLGLGLPLQNQNLFTNIPIPQGKSVQSVSCGKSHTMVLTTDHALYGTGLNLEGQLGLGIFPPVDQNTLVRVGFVDGKTPQYLSCGYLYTMVIMTDGTLYATGYNDWGQLGIGLPLGFRNFLTKVEFPVPSTTTVLYVSCGKTHSLAVLSDRTLYGTGYNGEGQLGLSDANNRVVFTLVPTFPADSLLNVTCSLNSSFALMTYGSLYSTGRNNYGQLGLGLPLNDYFEFMQVTYNVSNDVSYVMDMMIPFQPTPPPPVPCFLQGTRILTVDGYQNVESLQVGDWVQTYLHGPKKVRAIASCLLDNPSSTDTGRTPNRLYVLTREHYPDITEGDLVLTGGHALLLDSATEKVKHRVLEILSNMPEIDADALDMIATLKSNKRMIDGKETFLVCEDQHADFYGSTGFYCIWHFALEGEDEHVNYGVYANGLLVEAASFHFLLHHPYLKRKLV